MHKEFIMCDSVRMKTNQFEQESKKIFDQMLQYLTAALYPTKKFDRIKKSLLQKFKKIQF